MSGDERPPTSDDPTRLVRATRRRDDASRFIDRFAALTGIRLQSASIEGLPREFLARSVLPPPVLLERYAYELEPRTHNALRRYEPGRPQEPWTFGRLLDIRGFGAFSLLDLLEIMAEHDVRSAE